MIKELKAITIEIFASLWQGLAGSILSTKNILHRPTEMLTTAIYMLILSGIAKNVPFVIASGIMVVIIYIYKIIKEGKWKHRLRQNYV